MLAAAIVGIEDVFRLCVPSIVGAYYLPPQNARTIFLHNDLLCNDTCSVTGGTDGKDAELRPCEQDNQQRTACATSGHILGHKN